MRYGIQTLSPRYFGKAPDIAVAGPNVGGLSLPNPFLSLPLSHTLVEGGTLFLAPGDRLDISARALRSARSNVPGSRIGAGLGPWLAWTIN